MKRILPVEELARDSRFQRISIEERIFDPRNGNVDRSRNGFRMDDPEFPDASRGLMHSIFVGEIQALEGAGRTCWDFDTGTGRHKYQSTAANAVVITTPRTIVSIEPKKISLRE